MRKDLTEIVCILDKSGSMSNIVLDSIGGFNEFIKAQKDVPGQAKVTVVLFANEFDTIYDNVDIDLVAPLTSKTYVADGYSTSLYDAIGRTINKVGHRLHNTPQCDRPGKVMVAILTDGHENSSREFNQSKIKEMIEHQQSKYSWGFSFLAANQDAFLSAGAIGIPQIYTANFMADSAGTKSAYGDMTHFTTSYRCQQ